MKESCDGGTAARVTVLAQLQLLFSHYRYCLCMPLLTMHSPVIGAATASGARCPMQLQANYAGSCP
jgi:hypothetical protein